MCFALKYNPAKIRTTFTEINDFISETMTYRTRANPDCTGSQTCYMRGGSNTKCSCKGTDDFVCIRNTKWPH